jgi:hypothetical protein
MRWSMGTSEQAVAAEGGLILRCAFAESGMMVRYGVTMGAATVGDGFAEGGLILRSELAAGDIILRDPARRLRRGRHHPADLAHGQVRAVPHVHNVHLATEHYDDLGALPGAPCSTHRRMTSSTHPRRGTMLQPALPDRHVQSMSSRYQVTIRPASTPCSAASIAIGSRSCPFF